MARRQYTVADLVSAVRAKIDESNTDSVTDTGDILPALNRALDYAAGHLAKQYPEPFLRHSTLDLVSTAQEYDLPEDCFEDRIMRVEINDNGTYSTVERVSILDLGAVETSSSSPFPDYYAVVGRKIRFNRPVTGNMDARIWDMRQPEELVLPQGRITVVDLASNKLTVDEAGTDLDTETDQLESYVNVVDAQTGLIKCSLQIQSIDVDLITFRTTPVRPTVLNRTISGDMDLFPEIQLDDYICSVRGTAVPEFSVPIANYIIEAAASDINVSKFGADVASEEVKVARYEKAVTTTWGNRETTRRIQKKSPHLGRRPRRYIINNP